MAELPQDAAQLAERRVSALFAKGIGVVMLAMGIALAGLFVWATYKISSLNETPDFGAFVLLAIFGVLAAFCSLVGWRLALDRPNRFGSILSPAGWRLLAGIFAALAAGLIIFSAVLMRESASSNVLIMAITSVVSCAVFCHWCLFAARQAQTRNKD